MRQIFIVSLFFVLILVSSCQKPVVQIEQAINMKTINKVEFPNLMMEKIPGVPLLGNPLRIYGKTEEIIVEKNGLAYPTMYDWNKDGKLDLLVGEFDTGERTSFIKVYTNIGSSSAPRYSGKYEYAKDIEGNNITAFYW